MRAVFQAAGGGENPPAERRDGEHLFLDVRKEHESVHAAVGPAAALFAYHDAPVPEGTPRAADRWIAAAAGGSPRTPAFAWGDGFLPEGGAHAAFAFHIWRLLTLVNREATLPLEREPWSRIREDLAEFPHFRGYLAIEGRRLTLRARLDLPFPRLLPVLGRAVAEQLQQALAGGR